MIPSNMKFKIFILASYFVVLFIFSRTVDLVVMVYNGRYMIESTFVEPKKLSVPEIKSVLDMRGLEYHDIIMKSELVQLVKQTGNVSTEEVQDAKKSVLQPLPDHDLVLNSRFFNAIEDAQDTVWLVKVVPRHEGRFPENVWTQVKSKLSLVGVQTAVYDCTEDIRFCVAKKWTTPRLVLTIPHNSKYMLMHEYEYGSVTAAPHVISWVNDHLSKYVVKIQSHLILRHWLSKSHKDLPDTRVIMFSSTKSPSSPMFLSSLAVHFFERVAFTIVSSNVLLPPELGITTRYGPVYAVLTPEATLVYGQKRSESFNFKSLQQYLHTFEPKANDAFLWSLALVNAFVIIELLFKLTLTYTSVVVYAICILILYNGGLFLLWLCVDTPPLNCLSYFSLSGLRYVSGSCIGCLLRSDYKHLYTFEYFALTFILFAVVVTYFLKKLGFVEVRETSAFENWFRSLDFSRRPEPQQIMAEFVPDINYLPDLLMRHRVTLTPRERSPPSHIDIDSLPTWAHQDDADGQNPRNKFNMKDCVICLRSFDLNEMLCSLPCDHIFHLECMKSYSEMGQKQHCPVCRHLLPST